MLSWLRKRVAALGRTLVDNLPYLLLVGLGFSLAPYSLAYNHVMGAYLLATLAIFNVRLWLGKASASDLVSVFTFLSVSLWILLFGNADLVPYLAIILFSLGGLLAAVRLSQKRPAVFREEARVAENYLDTGVRLLLAVGCIAMSLAWMPQPRYVTGPFLALIVFRIAAPLRRWSYPRLLALFGVQPTDGHVRPPSPPSPRGFTPARGRVLAASGVLAIVVATRLVFTAETVDVSVPAPYVLPMDLLLERRAELTKYVANPPGSLDVGALTELGLVLHNLGLSREDDLRVAKEVLERAMFLDPGNAQARAWYGSNQVAFALYETRTLRRIELVSGGLKQLDRAVALAPDDPIVRFARLDVYLGVPRFIGTRPRWRKEVEELLRLARENPEAADPILPYIEHRAGDAYSRLGDEEQARIHWRAAQKMFPEDSEDYRLLAAQLRGDVELEARRWTRSADAGGGS